MKRKVLFLTFFFLLLFYYAPIFYNEIKSTDSISTPSISNEKNQEGDKKISPLPVTGFEGYIGSSIEDYVERHGEPIRIGSNGFGGEWWVFKSEYQDYVQIEVEDQLIESIFVLGELVDTGPIRIGMTKENVYDETKLDKHFSFIFEKAHYQLSLNKQDLKTFPLIKFENDTFVMLFLHPEKETIYGLRFLSYEALLRMGYYDIKIEEEHLINNQIEKDLNKDVVSEKETQFFDFFSVISEQQRSKPLKRTEELDQLAEEIIQQVDKNEFIFGENKFKNDKLIEELERYDKVKEIEYVIGNEIIDTPTQFGIFVVHSKNHDLLIDASLEEMSVKAFEDNLLLLFN